MNNNDGFMFFCAACKKSAGDSTCAIDYTIKRYSRGEYIAYQNSKVTNLPFLMKGKIKTMIVSEAGLTLQIAKKEAPFPIAATLLFAQENKFPVDVIALEDCEIMHISKTSIEQKIRECQEFLHGFLAFNASSLQYISERMTIFAQKGIKAKLSYYIISKETKGHFRLGCSLVSLSEYFGVERPSLSRAISEMVRDKVITFNSGEGDILNYEALQELIR